MDDFDVTFATCAALSGLATSEGRQHLNLYGLGQFRLKIIATQHSILHQNRTDIENSSEPRVAVS